MVKIGSNKVKVELKNNLPRCTNTKSFKNKFLYNVYLTT